MINTPFVFSRQRCLWQVILDSLSIGGLRQQVTSTDDNEKTFLMYAVGYGDVNVFHTSLKVLESYLDKTDVERHFKAQDNEGKNILHHAVQANNDNMLGKVIFWVVYERVLSPNHPWYDKCCS